MIVYLWNNGLLKSMLRVFFTCSAWPLFQNLKKYTNIKVSFKGESLTFLMSNNEVRTLKKKHLATDKEAQVLKGFQCTV